MYRKDMENIQNKMLFAICLLCLFSGFILFLRRNSLSYSLYCICLFRSSHIKTNTTCAVYFVHTQFAHSIPADWINVHSFPGSNYFKELFNPLGSKGVLGPWISFDLFSKKIFWSHWNKARKHIRHGLFHWFSTGVPKMTKLDKPSIEMRFKTKNQYITYDLAILIIN